MSTRKQQHKAAIRTRAQNALDGLYHNATVKYPRLDSDDPHAAEFESWFQDVAEQEIEYIASGGAYPGDYRATLAHSANSGRYKSEAARAYYIRAGMKKRNAERDDCGALTGWCVLELHAGNAKLTSAMREAHSVVTLLDLIRIVESFNARVQAWCDDVPEMWREHCAVQDAKALAEKREASARKAKETRERKYWAARGVITK